MKSSNIYGRNINIGQGKVATTLLTEDGCHYPVIHEPYSHRSYIGQPRSVSSPPTRVRRGDRPMHKTTFTMAKAPWEADYTTTNKQYHSGKGNLDPVRRPDLCPSMHRSQIVIGSKQDRATGLSDHHATFQPKELVPANRLHLLSFKNRIDQSEGANIKAVVNIHEQPSYWSQYNRVHNKLGALLGPGVGREYPIRQQYNILTGKEEGPAWSASNQRVSGNRVLHGMRGQINPESVLF